MNRSIARQLTLAALLIVGGLVLGSNRLSAAQEEAKLCGTATCGGDPCILCGKAEHQVCKYHANCQ
jgi:hypothetical protein